MCCRPESVFGAVLFLAGQGSLPAPAPADGGSPARTSTWAGAAKPQPQHCRERLPDLPLGDLRLTGHPVYEVNGHLTHREALHDAAVDHLDLEGITLRHDTIQADRLQHGSRITAIARCGVAYPESEQGPCVQVRTPREEPSVPAPAGHRAVVHVARPD